MNKVFALNYFEDGKAYKIYSKHPEKLHSLMESWDKMELNTSHDYVEHITYDNVEELLEIINNGVR